MHASSWFNDFFCVAATCYTSPANAIAHAHVGYCPLQYALHTVCLYKVKIKIVHASVRVFVDIRITVPAAIVLRISKQW